MASDERKKDIIKRMLAGQIDAKGNPMLPLVCNDGHEWQGALSTIK